MGFVSAVGWLFFLFSPFGVKENLGELTKMPITVCWELSLGDSDMRTSRN